MTTHGKYSAQLSHYLSGYVLVHAIGFITFPILTRVLDVSEYGILGIVWNSVLIAVAITKLGLQHSIIRFYEDYQGKSDPNSSRTYYSTFFFAALFVGFFGFLLYFLITRTIFVNIFDNHTLNLFSFTSIFIILECLLAFLTSFIRAQQNTKLYNFISIINRFGNFALGITFLFYLAKGLIGYFFGSMLFTTAVLVYLTRDLFRHHNVKPNYISPAFLKQALAYGLPLAILEVSHSLLNVADRYVIQYYLGAKALGLYSGAYTLAMQAVQLIDYPILLAVPVLYFEIWSKEGEQAVQVFLRNGLYYYSLIAFPAMFGVIAVSRELLVLIASNKFAASAPIIPFVVIGGMIFASSTLFSAGLYIHKKSTVAGGIMVVSVLINLSLNFALVPKYGISGAAIATLVGYASYVVMVIPLAFKYLSYVPDYLSILRFFLYSSVMFFIITQISLQHHVVNLFTRVITGVGIYGLLVLCCEKKVRTQFLEALRKRASYDSRIA